MSPQNAVFVIGAAWLAIGLCVATVMQRQGHPPSTAFAAVIAWPALLPVLGTPIRPGHRHRPCGRPPARGPQKGVNRG